MRREREVDGMGGFDSISRFPEENEFRLVRFRDCPSYGLHRVCRAV